MLISKLLAHHAGVLKKLQLRGVSPGQGAPGGGHCGTPGLIERPDEHPVDLQGVSVGKMASLSPLHFALEAPTGIVIAQRKLSHHVIRFMPWGSRHPGKWQHWRAAHQPPRTQGQRCHEQCGQVERQALPEPAQSVHHLALWASSPA